MIFQEKGTCLGKIEEHCQLDYGSNDACSLKNEWRIYRVAQKERNTYDH